MICSSSIQEQQLSTACAAEHGEVIRIDAVRDPLLRPTHQEMVALVDGHGTDTRDITTGGWLRDTQANHLGWH